MFSLVQILFDINSGNHLQDWELYEVHPSIGAN